MDVMKINKLRGVKSYMLRIWKDVDFLWLNLDYFKKVLLCYFCKLCFFKRGGSIF